MKNQLYLKGTVLLMIAAAFTFIQAQRWKIAEGYAVKFDAGDHAGEFTGLKGTIILTKKILALRNLM